MLLCVLDPEPVCRCSDPVRKKPAITATRFVAIPLMAALLSFSSCRHHHSCGIYCDVLPVLTGFVCKTGPYPCIVFGTRTTMAGSITGTGGVSAADSLCNSDANRGTGIYKALLVDGSSRIATVTANTGDGQVNWVLYPNKTYARTDGVVVFITGSNSLPGSFTGDAIAPTTTHYWTGFSSNYQTGTHCSAWTTGAAGSNANYGMTASLSVGTDTCNTLNGIYCVQQ